MTCLLRDTLQSWSSVPSVARLHRRTVAGIAATRTKSRAARRAHLLVTSTRTRRTGVPSVARLHRRTVAWTAMTQTRTQAGRTRDSCQLRAFGPAWAQAGGCLELGQRLPPSVRTGRDSAGVGSASLAQTADVSQRFVSGTGPAVIGRPGRGPAPSTFSWRGASLQLAERSIRPGRTCRRI